MNETEWSFIICTMAIFLQIELIIFKLMNWIHSSWWIVLIPLIIYIGLALVFVVLYVMIISIYYTGMIRDE